ncbi:MAG: HAD-IB family hydrolase [Anaerolineales bacterium]
MPIKVALFDVDGTLTTERVWRGVLGYYKLHGKRRGATLAFWMVHVPLFMLYKAKLLSQSAFRRPWAAHLMWFLRGDTPADAVPVWDWVVTEYLGKVWRRQGLTQIREQKANGDLVVLVSAGPVPLTERIAREVGADLAVGTQPAMRDGRYTGRVTGPVCLDEQKAALTRTTLAARRLDIDWERSTAYADGETDLALLEMVGIPVAFFPDERLKPIAIERGWKVVE